MNRPPDDPNEMLDPAEVLERETATLLRDVLHRKADAVHPSPAGLHRILAVTRAEGARQPGIADCEAAADLSVRPLIPQPRSGRPRRLSRLFPAIAAAAAVVVVVGGLGAVRLGVIHSATLASVVGAPHSERDGRQDVPPLPVYLMAQQQGLEAIVREYAPTPVTDQAERLTAALRLAVAGTGRDADLTSPWAAQDLTGDVQSEVTADGVTVRLSSSLLGDGRSTGSPAGATVARLAVQQLVWTATAVVGRDAPVRIEGPSAGSMLFAVLPLGRTFTRAIGNADPRAPVWVSSVTDGQRLRHGTAVVSGDALATATETVSWALIPPDGVADAAGTARLTRADGQAPTPGERAAFQIRLTVPTPGVYRLSVTQQWPSAGQPGVSWTDTKTLLVS